MALTRITSGVISANAVSAEKLANGALTSRTLANSSIELRHLAPSANILASVDTVSDNVNAVQSNLTANNIQHIANINIVSGNATSAVSNTITLQTDVSTISDNTVRNTANLDVIQDNVAAIIDGTTAFTGEVTFNDDIIITGNLIVNGDTTTANSVNMLVQDRIIMLANSATGTPAADVGFLFNRGDEGNAALFYDESASTFKIADTLDPSSNTTLSPVTLSNLAVGKLSYDGADLNTAIVDNRSGAISTVYSTDLTASRALSSDASGKIAVATTTLVELNYVSGVTSGIQAQIDLLDSQSNAHDTFTKLNANINQVSGNVDAISGGGTFLRPFSNVNTASGTSNVFFTGRPTITDANVVTVSLDGIIQSNNEFVYHHANDTIQFTDASIPSGTIVTIFTMT